MTHTIMKTRLLLMLILLSAGAETYAQNSYLILKVTRATRGSNLKLSSLDPGADASQNIVVGTYGSYAKGFNFQAGLGKMINSTMGFELTGELALGQRLKTNFDVTEDTQQFTGKITEHVNTILIKPVAVIRNSGDLLSFYTKLGLVIAPFIRKYQETEYVVSGANQDPLHFQLSARENAWPKVGFTASFGVSFRVSPSVSLFGEVSGQIMSLPIHKGHYTKIYMNGVDHLADTDVSFKEWRYKSNVSPNDNQDTTKPGTRLYNPANYTSIGLSVGMIYHL